ncbi:AT-rich interactive domain-containing protein 4A [Xenentodon cancila]
MKAADEPAYLTVGTDVSAKYRGAFCEAKIKTVKRMVKVKVNLKGESTSQVVQDDQVKGLLRVGSTVEVKTNEGLCSEAVISKLTDASLYTVVFDDGDEKTLRRTSLCLKGERHFAESETLDQLPLTNPEHFGTPVIGKKSNRGGRRSSQAVADEENETSSSEEEEEDGKRVTDELMGQVCSIENLEEYSNWFLALVVSPSCNDELLVKKDQCLTRSFADGTFYIVARRHVHIVNSMTLNKPDFFSRRGFEEAQMFLKNRQVPDVWKMDMSQILDSSSSEDDGDEKEIEKYTEEDEEGNKKILFKDEPEEEADPEERDNFLQQLYKFMEDRGTPINKPPVLGYQDLNLFKLFRLVYHLGGCHKIESGTIWKQVYMDLGIPVLNSAASYNVKTAYRKYLYGFEEYCRAACITFRTIHHNNPIPSAGLANHKKAKAESSTPPVKVELVDDKREEVYSETESEEMKDRQSSPRGRRRCVGSRVKLSSRPENAGRGVENSEEQQRELRRRSNRRMDDSEKGSEEDDDDEEEEDEEEEEEEGEEEDEEEAMVVAAARRGDGSEEEEDGDSVTGTKVRVKYGRGKTQKIYEAHIKKTDVDNGEQFYLVHYYGWNVRYDEWVKADRIIWPVEKGSKKRQKKKVKNKDKDEPDKEREKDEEKPGSTTTAKSMGVKRGRPQIRTTPTIRSGSKAPSSEGQSNGRTGKVDTGSSIANGDDTPRRRTRRTSGIYDSDRVSNGDSGNSSDDSDSEDRPDKKPSPWRGRPDPHPEREPEEEEEEEEEDEEEEEGGVEEDEDEEDFFAPIDNRVVAAATPAQLPTAILALCPSMLQEKADKVLSQSERKEVELGAEPVGEASMSATNSENKACPVTRTPPVPEKSKTSPLQEVQTPPPNRSTPPSRTPPHPETQTPTPSSTSTTEDERATSLSSPKLKVRRANFREVGSDPPSPAPSPPQTAVLLASPCSLLKRQEEPMVVLHCLPTQHLPPKSLANNSDTDSATEEEGEDAPEGSNTPLKRKAAEQRGAEKKLCPDRRQEVTPPSKTLHSAARSDRRSDGAKMEEWPRPAEEEQKEESQEPKERAETPPLPPDGLATDPAPNEELEPQIGPEALVCHEVDLDDPEEKEKPLSSSEHLPLMMREQQVAPPLVPHLIHTPLPSHHSTLLPQPHVRPFLLTAPPTPIADEPHLVKASPSEEQGAGQVEQEGNQSPAFTSSASSSSSSTSLLSLQDNKDRGQKRVNDCESSPSTKKHKRNQKRPNTPAKVDKNGAGHSSDSEDQSHVSSSSKPQRSRCPALLSPAAHKDKQSLSSPQRSYKWTLQLDELDSMSSTERISFLQEKLQEIRKYYMSLKSEVASIDRRRKRLKKKEREVSNTTPSTSSGSSDTGMSPSSASPAQNSVVVECR